MIEVSINILKKTNFKNIRRSRLNSNTVSRRKIILKRKQCQCLGDLQKPTCRFDLIASALSDDTHCIQTSLEMVPLFVHCNLWWYIGGGVYRRWR